MGRTCLDSAWKTAWRARGAEDRRVPELVGHLCPPVLLGGWRPFPSATLASPGCEARSMWPHARRRPCIFSVNLQRPDLTRIGGVGVPAGVDLTKFLIETELFLRVAGAEEALCTGMCGRHAQEQSRCWVLWFLGGANSYGQLGLGHKEDVLLPQQLKDFCKPACVRRITGGGGHSAVVTDEGGLFVCGLNKDGQLGLGHTEEVLYFTLCKSLLGCPIQQVACGWDFTIILTENGQVLSCGSNSFGQLGVPHGPRRCVVPQAIELLREKVVCVAAGLRHALAATVSGSVFQWGTGLASSGRRSCPGQTLPLFLTAKEPSRVTGLENSKAICVLAGSDHSASLTDAGELYVWGSNKHGQLATQTTFLLMPQKIEAHWFQNEKITAIWSGWTHLVAQTETGKMFTWGRADYGQLGRKLEPHEGCKLGKQGSFLPCSTSLESTPSSLHCLMGATEVSCGSEHNLAVIGGACHSWGWNEHGMCGDGTEANVWAPKPVQFLQSTSGLLVGCGAGHSLALCRLLALPALGQDPKVIYPSLDVMEDTESQEAMDKERNRKEKQSETSTQSQPDRSRNGGL